MLGEETSKEEEEAAAETKKMNGISFKGMRNQLAEFFPRTESLDAFKFMNDSIGLGRKDTEGLDAAIGNMADNAEKLRADVGKYISSWGKLKHLPSSLVKMINGVAMPLAKTAADSAGLGLAAKSASLVAGVVWGDLASMCQEVVERSCMDVMVEASSCSSFNASDTEEALDAFASAFRAMHKCIDLHSYAEFSSKIPDENLRLEISRKFRTPLHDLETTFAGVVQLLRTRQCEERLEEIENRLSITQPRKSNDGWRKLEKALP